jgi:putative N6-adenine-specific DNA methylase
MAYLTLIATSSFGVESVLADELRELGYSDFIIENGRVKFKGDFTDAARCNIHVRTAERILWEVADFEAKDFEELFQRTIAVRWEDFIPANAKMHVTGKSIKSTLFSVPDCQSIVKKAIIEAMKRRYKKNWFEEDGPTFKIEIALLKDRASLTIDTSGAGLHKRGYRIAGGEAPLRETLAAAIIRLSKWNAHRVFADPLCGSGTFPIEAALTAKNIPPGLHREFAAEEWPFIPKKVWKTVREKAREQIQHVIPAIFASDIDDAVFKKARDNAARAGVSDYIVFQKKPLSEFSSKKKFGVLVTNPPYGERIGDIKESEKIYQELGSLHEKLESWSFFILTPHENFIRHFGEPSTKNRKLYNGKIKCYLHQYFGPLPDSR